MSLDLFAAGQRHKSPVRLQQPPTLGHQGYEMAAGMLHEFGKTLQLQEGLRFNKQNTCTIDYGRKCTLIITYDPETERLYVYSVLLSALPQDPDEKLELYEFLLEGSLLGRDMAGGGVGISLRDNKCIMCTSLDVKNSEQNALGIVVPSFVGSLLEWRQRCQKHPACNRGASRIEPTPAHIPPPHIPSQQQPMMSIPPAPIVAPTAGGPSVSDSQGLNIKSRALLIGINYFQSAIPLGHCTDNARDMQNFLMRNGFDNPDDIKVLVDDTIDPMAQPTKENIIRGLQWLVQGAREDDSLFLAFSGHGRKEQQFGAFDENGEPIFTSSICPSDFQRYGSISTIELNDLLIQQLPPRCTLNVVMDCTNGCVTDLGLGAVYYPDDNHKGDALQMVPTGTGLALQTAGAQTSTVVALSSSFDFQRGEHPKLIDAYTSLLNKKPTQTLVSLVHSIAQIVNSSKRHNVGLFSTKRTDLTATYML